MKILYSIIAIIVLLSLLILSIQMRSNMLSKKERNVLLKLARNSLENYLQTGNYIDTQKFIKENLTDSEINNISKQTGGVFITLTKNGDLRGCIGTIISDEPIYLNIAEYAVNAGVRDPRFKPVRLEELKDIKFEISILTEPKDINSIDEIIVGRDGVILTNGSNQAVFLPQVALEWGWNREGLLKNLSLKAGLNQDAYLDKNSKFKIFQAIVFAEDNNSINIKQSDFSGSFYSSNSEELNNQLENFIFNNDSSNQSTRAIIVPHAGYIYSGKTAGIVYNILRNNTKLKTIVILAPSHNFNLNGIAYSSYDYFETPLGKVKVNKELTDVINDIKLESLLLENRVFYEHSLEVQIPFIQKAFGNDIEIFPLIVGNASPDDVEKIISTLWQDEMIGFVFSSDMSHYLTKADAKKVDMNTIKLIENLNYQDLSSNMLCGINPVRGLLKFAKDNNYRIENIVHSDSGDYSGDDNRVVGYGGFILVNN